MFFLIRRLHGEEIVLFLIIIVKWILDGIIASLRISDAIALGWFAAFNAATFLSFALDKWRAVRMSRRIPENVLLALAALGGWFGGWLGMELFRHKTVKFGFRLRYAAAIVPFMAELWFWWQVRGR